MQHIVQQSVFGAERTRPHKIIVLFFYSVRLQISVTLCKDQPNTPLVDLMKKEGAKKVRAALGSYVGHLKTGQTFLLCVRYIVYE